MGRNTLEEKVVHYIRNAVDLTVGTTGYPVLGRYLEEAGIATRKQLRALERKGLLKSVRIKQKNTMHPLDTQFNYGSGTEYVAYYTERAVPEKLQKRQEELRNAPTVADEVIQHFEDKEVASEV